MVIACPEDKVTQTPVAVASFPALVGAVLSSIRKSQGRSQADLAEALSLNVSTWSRIENGESALTVEQLALAAEVLGVSPSAVLRTTEEKVVELSKRGIATSVNRANFEAIAASGSIPLVGATLLGTINPIGVFSVGAVAGYQLYSHLMKKNHSSTRKSNA